MRYKPSSTAGLDEPNPRWGGDWSGRRPEADAPKPTLCLLLLYAFLAGLITHFTGFLTVFLISDG